MVYYFLALKIRCNATCFKQGIDYSFEAGACQIWFCTYICWIKGRQIFTKAYFRGDLLKNLFTKVSRNEDVCIWNSISCNSLILSSFLKPLIIRSAVKQESTLLWANLFLLSWKSNSRRSRTVSAFSSNLWFTNIFNSFLATFAAS